jgi:hypothetical protein
VIRHDTDGDKHDDDDMHDNDDIHDDRAGIMP